MAEKLLALIILDF